LQTNRTRKPSVNSGDVNGQLDHRCAQMCRIEHPKCSINLMSRVDNRDTALNPLCRSRATTGMPIGSGRIFTKAWNANKNTACANLHVIAGASGRQRRQRKRRIQ
jgi:hypothetical protein